MGTAIPGNSSGLCTVSGSLKAIGETMLMIQKITNTKLNTWFALVLNHLLNHTYPMAATEQPNMLATIIDTIVTMFEKSAPTAAL